MAGSEDLFVSSTAPLTFHEFLEKMRQPSASDLVRSIKSFISSFESSPAGTNGSELAASEASARTLGFMAGLEEQFREHSLWQGATQEELEAAGEGLEKYLMTKLYSHTFAVSAEDQKMDALLDARMKMLDFLRPEHLDIPANVQNEQSWLLAEKELQKMNSFKAPRDKLVCVLNCCRVITNLLAVTAGEAPGADDFIPVLIYVVLKSGTPQLHSNLEYIARFRSEERLRSEALYFYTNLVSAKEFILSAKASQLTDVDPQMFNHRMRQAGLMSPDDDHQAEEEDAQTRANRDQSRVSRESSEAGGKTQSHTGAVVGGAPCLPSMRELEQRGQTRLLELDHAGELGLSYRFLYSDPGHIRLGDVNILLRDYKEIVLKYEALRLGVDSLLNPVKSDGNSCSNISPSQTQALITPQKVPEPSPMLPTDNPQISMDIDPNTEAIRKADNLSDLSTSSASPLVSTLSPLSAVQTPLISQLRPQLLGAFQTPASKCDISTQKPHTTATPGMNEITHGEALVVDASLEQLENSEAKPKLASTATFSMQDTEASLVAESPSLAKEPIVPMPRTGTILDPGPSEISDAIPTTSPEDSREDMSGDGDAGTTEDCMIRPSISQCDELMSSIFTESLGSDTPMAAAKVNSEAERGIEDGGLITKEGNADLVDGSNGKDATDDPAGLNLESKELRSPEGSEDSPGRGIDSVPGVLDEASSRTSCIEADEGEKEIISSDSTPSDPLGVASSTHISSGSGLNSACKSGDVCQDDAIPTDLKDDVMQSIRTLESLRSANDALADVESVSPKLESSEGL